MIAALAGAAVLGAAWLLLAPPQLGGSTSYAIVVGSSMEPSLERGDLAIVRARSTYRPGDAVLYESGDLGANVLHRIERVEGGRFVTKGDNNDFLDPERPAEAQIVGTLWTTVPNVGLALEWLRQPLHAAILVALATLFGLGGIGTSLAIGRRGGGRRPSPRPVRAVPQTERTRLDDERLKLVAGVVLAAAVCLGLAALAFTRPTSATVADEAAWSHQGRFAYEAAVPRSAAYPDGRVDTGEPVFLRLVPTLDVSFSYRVDAVAATATALTARLDARIGDGRGWERTLPLAAETRVDGSTAVVSGRLDLRRLGRLVERVRELTGSAQAAYTVAVQPHVRVSGRVGADAVDTEFAPALLFDLGDLRLQPNLGGEGVGPLAPRQSVRGTRVAPAELSLGVGSLQVATARKVSLGGLAALLLLAGLALLGGGSRPVEEHARIARRYGHLLLSVRPPAPEWPRVVELADVDALARLATHEGRMILHLADATGHSYVVEHAGVAYSYRAEAPGLRAAPAAPARALGG